MLKNKKFFFKLKQKYKYPKMNRLEEAFQLILNIVIISATLYFYIYYIFTLFIIAINGGNMAEDLPFFHTLFKVVTIFLVLHGINQLCNYHIKSQQIISLFLLSITLCCVWGCYLTLLKSEGTNFEKIEILLIMFSIFIFSLLILFAINHKHYIIILIGLLFVVFHVYEIQKIHHVVREHEIISQDHRIKENMRFEIETLNEKYQGIHSANFHKEDSYAVIDIPNEINHIKISETEYSTLFQYDELDSQIQQTLKSKHQQLLKKFNLTLRPKKEIENTKALKQELEKITITLEHKNIKEIVIKEKENKNSIF